MNVFFDLAGARRFAYQASVTIDEEERSYYCLAADDARLAILVTRGAALPDLAGRVVDVTLGWDKAYPGYVYYPRQLHTKITAYRLVANEPNATLSELLDNAPIRRNPNV